MAPRPPALGPAVNKKYRRAVNRSLGRDVDDRVAVDGGVEGDAERFNDGAWWARQRRRRRRSGGALGASGAPRSVALLFPGVSLERAMRHRGRRRRWGGALRATAATGPAAPDLPFMRVEGAVLAARCCGYLRRED